VRARGQHLSIAKRSTNVGARAGADVGDAGICLRADEGYRRGYYLDS